jgi:cytochrome c553
MILKIMRNFKNLMVFFSCFLAGLATAQASETLQEKVELCATCHGKTGLPEQEDVPIIAGQHFYYLYVQLRDFKAGRRSSDVMQLIVEDFDKAEMKELATYFSEKKWPYTSFKSTEAEAAAGETASGAGQCVQCHLGGYEGNSRIPRLNGQSYPYLLKTMTDFKDRIRLNSAAKSSLMGSYSEQDIENMARFLAGF